MTQNLDPSFKGQTDWNEEARKEGGADVNQQPTSQDSLARNPEGPDALQEEGPGYPVYQQGYPQGGAGDYGTAGGNFPQTGNTGKSPGGPNSPASTGVTPAGPGEVNDPGSPGGTGFSPSGPGGQFGGGIEKGTGQGSGMGRGSTNEVGTPGQKCKDKKQG